MTIRRVGLIGAGLMGHDRKDVLARGHELVVMPHRNRVPIDDLIARSASERATPREIANTRTLLSYA
jgi:3-hydroxyisobutyrate dehydrogenase-like beta-hydroxyacid dehydrogenase